MTESPDEGWTLLQAMRTRLLTADPSTDLGIDAAAPVWGAMMEMGLTNGVATLICLRDGTTSLYLSSGGGVIGGGSQPKVVAANSAFLDRITLGLERLTPDESTQLPAPGRVVFRALTRSGRRVGEAGEPDLAQRRSDLWPLFYTGQDVITEVRLISAANSDDR